MAHRNFPFFTYLVLILAFLLGSAAVAHGEDPIGPIQKKITETTYEEVIKEFRDTYVYPPLEGKDPYAPETLGSEKVYTLSLGNGIEFKIVKLCSTSKTGPRCYSKASVYGEAPPNAGPGIGETISSQADIMAEGVVVNIYSDEPQEVPIVVSGKASVQAASAPWIGTFETTAVSEANVWMTLGYKNMWDIDVIQEDSMQAISIGGDIPKPEARQMTLRINVPVGSEFLAKQNFHIDIHSFAVAGGYAGGDSLGYGLSQSGADAWARIDPQVYIDPTWPDAHKYVLVFKDDVCFGCGDSTPVLPLLLDD